MKKIDVKTIYEVCPDIPANKTDCICKRCGKQMQVWGEVTSISWNDYLDGSGELIDLCEPCANLVIEKMHKIIYEK